MATAGPLIINLGDSTSPPPSSHQPSPPHTRAATATQFSYNKTESISAAPASSESSTEPANALLVDQKFTCPDFPTFHKLLAGSKSVPADSRVLDFREFPPVPVHHIKSSARPATNVSQAFSEGVVAPANFSQFSPSGVYQNRFIKPFSSSNGSSRNGSLSPVSPAHKSLSPSTSPLNKSFSPVKSPLNKSFSPVKSTPFHKPLCAQRSSPSLHRPGTRATLVRTPPKSPLLFASVSSRKLSCPKISRVSPTQFKFQQYQYSKVPKSDSAFSEDTNAYSPISRGYSPSLVSPVSPPKLKSSRTQDSGISYPFILHKSESSYSEQNVPCRSASGLPKSRSTIFRSDSAYSDIEYSYSTIPQSESFCLEEEYAYLSLPKSESTYSENILTYSNEKQRGPIQRSLSSCSYQFAASFSPPECGTSLNEEKGVSFCRSVIGARRRRYRSLSHTSSPRLSQSQVVNPLQETTGVRGKTHHSSLSSPTNFIMPTLKSLFKTPSRQSIPGKASRFEKTPKKSFINRDISALNLTVKSSGSTCKHSIKKSHTVLALSSNVATNYSASTKLLASGDEPSPCKIHRCLSKTLLKSISQTLNSSVGQSLNKSDAPCPPRKRSRRRSQLSAFLPRSLSRASSLASAGASYLGSYIGSLGSGEGDTLYCRLCLMDVSVNMMCQLTLCQCRFCRYCMSEYTRVKILEGEHRIECPDGSCDARDEGVGELTAEEIESLVGKDLLAQRNKLKLNAEVIADPFRVFCPQPGCETIIRLNRPKFDVLDSDVSSQPKSDVSENITLTIPKTPLKVPAENLRTRRVGTTVNLYMKNQPETSLRTETALVELNTSVVSSSPERVPSTSRSSDQTPHSSDRISVTSENDLTSIKNKVEPNVTLGDAILHGSSSREIECSTDTQSEEERLITERKISLDEVNMIKDIKRPKILPLTSSPRPQRLAEYPADPELSAAMAALQSPADYRPFAALPMPPEAVEYRALQGIPEVPDAEGMSSDFGVICPTCQFEFCPSCGQNSHPNGLCQPQLLASSKGIKMQYRRLMGMDSSDLPGVIKCCPNPKCQVAIERNEGCAQMQCRACKHTFCWYCLASLEEDFLLRHYDKGPCRNKLGHSRASVLCHRLQVIAIFLSVGLLVFAAAPLLVLVGPCVLCCKCKLERDAAENSPDEN